MFAVAFYAACEFLVSQILISLVDCARMANLETFLSWGIFCMKVVDLLRCDSLILFGLLS